MKFKHLLFLSAAACLTAACTHTQADTATAKSAAVQTHTVESRYGFEDTVARLQSAVRDKGMTVFAVIDHRAAAQSKQLDMQPATVIVFGNPQAGTPLMVKDPVFALQLPLRVLVTETDGRVRVAFNDTRALIKGSGIAYSDVEKTLAGAEKLIRATVTQ